MMDAIAAVPIDAKDFTAGKHGVTKDTLPTPESDIEINAHGVRATVDEYTQHKTNDSELQNQMRSRVESVAKSGAKKVSEQISTLFPTDILAASSQSQLEASTESPKSYSELLVEEQQHVLEGQQEKIDRMTAFVADMQQHGEQLIAEISAAAQANTGLTAEQKQQFIGEYTKSVQELIIDATRTITFQDTRASSVTLGDHGWMHLTQDARDTMIIAEGKRGAPLSSKERFMVGLAAAYHDVGYAVPEVSDPQRTNGGSYGKFDQGHPINSYVAMVVNIDKFQHVLGKESTDGLLQMVANHENPERAERAGIHADLSEAFALADASAAFGRDKLPSVLVQIPEALAYMNAVSMAESSAFAVIYDQIPRPPHDISFEAAQAQFKAEVVEQLKNEAIAAIDTKIGHKAPPEGEENQEAQDTLLHQADALKNALTHFGPNSKKFLLGRMSAESARITVDDQKRVVFDINAGFARKLDSDGTVTKSTEASAVLTVKLFLEQAALKPSKTVENILITAVGNGEMPTDLTAEQIQEVKDAGVEVTVLPAKSKEDQDAYVQLATTKIVVTSFTQRVIGAENSDFYTSVQQNLGTANTRTDTFIKKFKT